MEEFALIFVAVSTTIGIMSIAYTVVKLLQKWNNKQNYMSKINKEF